MLTMEAQRLRELRAGEAAGGAMFLVGFAPVMGGLVVSRVGEDFPRCGTIRGDLRL